MSVGWHQWGAETGCPPHPALPGGTGTGIQMNPFPTKSCRRVSPFPCAKPPMERAVKGCPCASPHHPPPTEPTAWHTPSPACMALYCPRGPQLNPLERARRSIARHCHRTPPTLLVPAVCPPSCRAMPSCHSMLLFHAAEPLPQPHPDPRRIGKEREEMWFSFFSGTARPELSHCHADLLFPGRIMSFTSAHLATEVGKK